eukprot:4795697-Amphidinium_carterae.2
MSVVRMQPCLTLDLIMWCHVNGRLILDYVLVQQAQLISKIVCPMDCWCSGLAIYTPPVVESRQIRSEAV